MRYDTRLTVMVILAVTLAMQWAVANDVVPNCLYGAFTQGDEQTPVEACGDDVKHIGMDPDVRAIMRTFNIPQGAVVFKACPGGRFSAMPDGSSAKRFVVRYPSTVRSDYLAPIVHELAHVVQMRTAGGLQALNPEKDSRRIELGADFLTGLAFGISLPHLNMGDFEANLHLVGSYKLERRDHGTPEDRTMAFRAGAVRYPPYPDLTVVDALNYWYLNHYALLRR